jgi:hypothetical protein
MRMRRILVGLVSLVAACGPMRSAGPSVPAAVAPPPPALAAPRAPRPPEPPRGSRELLCLDHPAIDAWEHRMRSRRALRRSAERTLSRGERYLDTLRAIMRQEGLPQSLALLPAIESGFRPHARGRYGDVGMWQLRSPTARRFGLVVRPGRDDRLDPERSTRAAARYLRYLHKRYRDWPFALAAYNAGEGRVDRARRRDRAASFWQLADEGHLPRTSRDFVPKFLALVRVSESRHVCRPVDVPGVRQARN